MEIEQENNKNAFHNMEVNSPIWSGHFLVDLSFQWCFGGCLYWKDSEIDEVLVEEVTEMH